MKIDIAAWMLGYLTGLASSGAKPITYSDFTEALGKGIRSDADVGALGRYLDVICELEAEEDRPMLTALLISKDTGRPGEGFYDMARKLNKYAGTTEQDDIDFFKQELQAVYDTWVY